ncbi:hypothetical protein DL96DRAFT_1533830 [Flagelloscypha sp. PMI_526]|nr:hypothetical protein DL96DRAFT_1533830 [Flagelloscypha sp. PMI_526]
MSTSMLFQGLSSQGMSFLIRGHVHSRSYLDRADVQALLNDLIHSLVHRPKRLKTRDISGLQVGTLDKIDNALSSVLTTQDSLILGQLNVSREAPFTSVVAENVQRVSCTPGTRVAILQKLLDWATAQDYDIKNALFWLCGLAGTGKTTILRDICQSLHKLNLLASSYFCSIQPSSGDSRHLVPTIARHLASRSQTFKTALVEQLQQDPDLFSATLQIQFQSLLCEPWKAATNSRVHSLAQVVAVDALDECDQGEEFLHLLLDAIDAGQLEGIRFIVTSRPVPDLLQKVRASRPDSPQVSLHEVPKGEVNGDIKRYLEASLTLPETLINELVARSNGLFIYASTLVKYLKPLQLLAPIEFERRLEMVIAQQPERSSINPLYKQIVDVALSLEDDGGTRRRWMILQAILCAAEPPTAHIVARLLGVDPQIVTAVVESLYSVLFAGDFNGPIYIFHASFHDFVVSYIDGEHYCHLLSIHSILAQSCIAEMTNHFTSIYVDWNLPLHPMRI